MPLESFSEHIFMQDVERLGGQALKQDASVNAGIPDRLCWLLRNNGTIIWFWAEWKQKNKELQKHQDAYARRLAKQGHLVFKFDSNVHARAVMKALL